jgi:hypothetical protein
MLIFKDECPQFLYKYCTQSTYDEYLAKGSFRFGTLANYRRVNEIDGSEYGDSHEGSEHVLFSPPGNVGGIAIPSHGAIIISRTVNALVFCASFEYNQNDHLRWFNRKGCGYDICLKLDARPLIEQLARKIRIHFPAARIIAAKPIYKSGLLDTKSEKPEQFQEYLFKNPNLKWEKEYRVLVEAPQLGVEDILPHCVQYLRLSKYIKEIKRLQLEPNN